MIIKEANGSHISFKRIVKNIILNNKIYTIVIITIFIVIFFIGLVYYGALLQRDSSMGGFRQALNHALSSNISIPFNYIKGQLNSKIKHISIDIKHKDLQELGYNRKLAYQRGIISESEYFPAKISYNGEKYIEWYKYKF